MLNSQLISPMWLIVQLTSCGSSPEAALFDAPIEVIVGGLCTDARSVDLDNDGLPELIAADFDANQVVIYGSVSFSRILSIPVGGHPIAIGTIDVNQDGNVDIVAVNRDSDSISVLMNASNSDNIVLFDPFEVSVHSYPVAIAISDLNNDGREDLIIASQGLQTSGDARFSVILNETGVGAELPTFGERVDVPSGTATNSVGSADINLDGKQDLVGANLTGLAVVSINLTSDNSDVAAFTPGVEFNVAGNPSGVTMVDLTGDLKPEIVTASLTVDAISVLVNKTVDDSLDPKFEEEIQFDVGVGPVALATMDANDDGLLDIVVANLGSSDVSILKNGTSGRAIVPNMLRLDDVPTGDEPNSISVYDVNADGRVDIVTGNRGGSVSLSFGR